MKQIIIIGVTTILFIIFALYINLYLEKTSGEITKHIANIESYSKTGNWPSVKNELLLSDAYWSKTQDKWAMLIEHEEIDKIDSSFSKISKYIEEKNTNDLLAENSNLKLLIEHIPEMYKLNIKNVL